MRRVLSGGRLAGETTPVKSAGDAAGEGGAARVTPPVATASPGSLDKQLSAAKAANAALSSELAALKAQLQARAA